MTYWVRGGELLNTALMYYEPNAAEFEREDWGDWFPIDHAEMQSTMSRAFGDDPRKHDVLALAGAMENPTKWGLYDRDAFEHWQEGRVCLLGDAAHPMLPTMGQGASQSFEDGAALGCCFKLHGTDVYSALLHYERVRHYRATRFQFAIQVPVQAPRAAGFAGTQDAPQGAERARLSDLRPRAAGRRRRLVDLRVRRAEGRRQACRRRSSGPGTSARAARRSRRASRSRRISGRRRSR